MNKDDKVSEKVLDNSLTNGKSNVVCPDTSSSLFSTEILDSYSSKNDFQPKQELGKVDFTSQHQNKIIAISGALGGFLSGILVCPLDVAKTRLQAQGIQTLRTENKYYHGLINTLTTIINDEGIRGLYKGLTPIVLGYFPTWMIYFSVYERCKNYYPNIISNNNFLNNSLAAISAGTVSTLITNPIWVVKTRLMLQTHIVETRTNYNGTLDAFHKIYSQEGIRALYAGLIPSFLGLFHVAIHFPVFENLKKQLHCYEKTFNSVTNKFEYSLNLRRLIIASCISKVIASSITYPHEILRTRMQLKSDIPNSIQHHLIPLIRTTFRQEGIRGFYSGFTTNIARTVPASAITLVSFEYIRIILTKFDKTLDHKP